MRIGVDVGGTNTDAVLMDGTAVAAWTKQPTSADISTGVAAAIRAVLATSGVDPRAIESVTIGTTHFTNALVERRDLDRVGVLRLASPSGEALPPMTAWSAELVERIGRDYALLPGGYEVDGREMAPLDETKLRGAADDLRRRGILSVAISCAFAPINAAMELRAADLVREVHPAARISLSHEIGRIGFIERENATILNAALASLAGKTVASFQAALATIGVDTRLYISQNDGTLISAEQAARYPVLTIGSGPTNSMRGAAFLTGLDEAIVMDVGGTTTDIGVLTGGYPRESSISVDIGGVRTNFRMPDVMAIGLGGGTRIHLDSALYEAAALPSGSLRVGPDSAGFRITEEARLFGGSALTASDVAVAAGRARFGDAALLPALAPGTLDAIWSRIQQMLEDGMDRMKTARGDVPVIAVGGGSFLIAEDLKGASRVIRPRHAAVANAVGAAIAQVGAQVERIVDYDATPRPTVLEQVEREARDRAVAAGACSESIRIVDVDEVFLAYLPGRQAQLRLRAVGDLAMKPKTFVAEEVRHADVH